MQKFTASYWFSRVEKKKLRDQLLHNLSHHGIDASREYESLEEAVECSFYWKSTKEGDDYWQKKHERGYFKKTHLLPPPCYMSLMYWVERISEPRLRNAVYYNASKLNGQDGFLSLGLRDSEELRLDALFIFSRAVHYHEDFWHAKNEEAIPIKPCHFTRPTSPQGLISVIAAEEVREVLLNHLGLEDFKTKAFTKIFDVVDFIKGELSTLDEDRVEIECVLSGGVNLRWHDGDDLPPEGKGDAPEEGEGKGDTPEEGEGGQPDKEPEQPESTAALLEAKFNEGWLKENAQLGKIQLDSVEGGMEQAVAKWAIEQVINYLKNKEDEGTSEADSGRAKYSWDDSAKQWELPN